MKPIQLQVVPNLDDRYQYQTRLIRACRWLRWYPAYCLFACYLIVKWFVTYYSQVPTSERYWFTSRIEYARHIWRLVTSAAHLKMKFYYTMEEVITNCRNKLK